MGRQTTLGKLPDGTPFHCINKMEMLFCYKEIFDQGAYESPLINFKEGDIILDVGANIGRVAGAGMPDHVHLHVVPRWNGDTNFMPVLGEVKVINEHLTQTAAKLSEAFSSS